MKIRDLFRKSSRPILLNDNVSALQRAIDSEHGKQPVQTEPRDSYRKLSEVPQSRWL
jgi:hypothetical protein